MKRQGTGARYDGEGTRREEAEHRGSGSSGTASRLIGPAIVLLAAALAIAPQLIRGDSCGHDFDFHLVSWFDALDSWRHGLFYPHWAPSPNFTAGEPRFVFYPPLTWMLGAALGAVLPWTLVAAALTFLLLAGTGLATRALARQAMSHGAATLAGCIAIFSGYTLYTAYERSAFAELAGGFWIPLILMLVRREGKPGQSVWRRAFDGTTVLLGLVVAGAWLSNAPVGVMACYFLAAIATAVALLQRAWMPVLRAAVGAALGLALAAFYIVPAAVEQNWVAIHQATDDPGERIENSFLFGHHANLQLALHDVELQKISWIALAMLGAVFVALMVTWRRRTLPGGHRWWVPLALIPPAILMLLVPLSLPVWDTLPKLRFLQFPWRWLVVLEAPLGIFAASAVWVPRRRLRNVVFAACGLAFLSLTVFAGRSFFQICDEEDAVVDMLQAYRNGEGFQGTDEYEPPETDSSLVAEDLPPACLVKDAAAVLGVRSGPGQQPDWAPEQKSCISVLEDESKPSSGHWRVRGRVPAAGFLVLRLRRYPAWRVQVNGVRVTDTSEREDGLMAVPVRPGPVDVRADWMTTPDVRLGRWISLLAAAIVAGLGAMAWRRERAQLK